MPLATHSGQLERWLGKEAIENVSESMRNWYGPPIALAGVPGKVFAHKGGDFRGRISEGRFANYRDHVESVFRRVPGAFRRAARNQSSRANTGFASLSDLISETTVGGKRDSIQFNKVGTTGVVAATNSLWRVGNMPAAGAAASAAPGGTVPTRATTGAMPFNNPAVGGDSTHFIGGNVLATVAPNTLLLYDRIFAVAKTMASTATEAVTGVPTRYQSTTPGAFDSAEGNFCFPECGTALPATAHNWTVCTYTDQGGAAGTIPSFAGNSSNIVNRLDMPTGQWFVTLAAGDYGVKTLTQLQLSASLASGAIDWVIGHPIAFMPVPVANMCCTIDGINTAFNLIRLQDNGCFALLEVTKSATGATTYNGSYDYCAG